MLGIRLSGESYLNDAPSEMAVDEFGIEGAPAVEVGRVKHALFKPCEPGIGLTQPGAVESATSVNGLLISAQMPSIEAGSGRMRSP